MKNVLEKYHLVFKKHPKSSSLVIHSNSEYEILAHFLMLWCNPKAITADLLPLIDKGIKYGNQEYWQEKGGWSGYFIPNENMFLEGIDPDVVGLAFVTTEMTSITDSDLNFKNISLPSIDFRNLVLKWLAYILENKGS